ncbi:hypothetical protein ACQPYV_02095 [Micromonospora saelicesensis]|nr:hypothetical protein [Micromonospora saelicesensis]
MQRVMGHEQASATLNRYTHTPDDYAPASWRRSTALLPRCCLRP